MHLLAGAVSKLVKGHSCSLRLVSQKFKVIFVVYFLLSHARFKVVIKPFQTRRHFSCKKMYMCVRQINASLVIQNFLHSTHVKSTKQTYE